MAATLKNSDNDMQVTFEDQEKINKFARHNAKLQDLKDELTAKKKDLQNLEDASDELLLLEDENTIPYQIGEVFVSLSPDETSNMLDAAKVNTQKDIEAIEKHCDGHKQILSELKVQLYAKFGNNINLEAEEE
ncbi:prefoldin subunit 4-like [Liolophura sinensis]|uniref:prefoldin subunit 4-like n=1 Tax=Liolophura sinensis TaxID=3198878 RepID=UPI0031582EB3